MLRLSSHWLKTGRELFKLAKNEINKGDIALSERYLHEAVTVLKQEGDSRFPLSCALSSLSNVLATKRDFEKAIIVAEECLTIRKSEVGINHLSVAEAIMNCATLQYHIGQFERSASLYEESLGILLECSNGNEDNAYVAYAFLNLGLSYLKLPQRRSDGMSAIEKSKRIADIVWGADSVESRKFHVDVSQVSSVAKSDT